MASTIKNRKQEEGNMKPYPKHDHILHRDLTAAERLQPQRATLHFIKRMCDQLENTLNHASNDLTEEQLEKIADAVQCAFNAMSNAKNLGTSDYIPLPVRLVIWK